MKYWIGLAVFLAADLSWARGRGFVNYRCPGGEILRVKFHDATDYRGTKWPRHVRLEVAGRGVLQLPEEAGAQGGRFSDGFTVLRVEADTVTLEAGTLQAKKCREIRVRDANALAGKYTLVEEGGRAVTAKKAPTLEFGPQPGRVSGFAGCNRLNAGYQLDGHNLRFQAIAGTRMACPGAASELEARFHKALSETAGYFLESNTLQLLDAQGTALARFRKN